VRDIDEVIKTEVAYILAHHDVVFGQVSKDEVLNKIKAAMFPRPDKSNWVLCVCGNRYNPEKLAGGWQFNCINCGTLVISP
jgi:hypothetical protein